MHMTSAMNIMVHLLSPESSPWSSPRGLAHIPESRFSTCSCIQAGQYKYDTI